MHGTVVHTAHRHDSRDVHRYTAYSSLLMKCMSLKLIKILVLEFTLRLLWKLLKFISAEMVACRIDRNCCPNWRYACLLGIGALVRHYFVSSGYTE